MSFMYTQPQAYAKVMRHMTNFCKAKEKQSEAANKILLKRIEVDPFLDLMTVQTEVIFISKAPYNIHESALKSKGLFQLDTTRMRLFDVWIEFVNLGSEDYTIINIIPIMDFGDVEQEAYKRVHEVDMKPTTSHEFDLMNLIGYASLGPKRCLAGCIAAHGAFR
ncbi:hypothetical protein L1987_23865 [Smallanthus sonchifolius]|uniref:Uncharacterized protein n=1 Tax=Smallanthus sonchifolius TaxID=185202 RepID=A0ACB9ILG5_9ASTR|nr:hypothetical protein L1987_23865 [Smallanthus sonchifolius]